MDSESVIPLFIIWLHCVVFMGMPDVNYLFIAFVYSIFKIMTQNRISLMIPGWCNSAHVIILSDISIFNGTDSIFEEINISFVKELEFTLSFTLGLRVCLAPQNAWFDKFIQDSNQYL